TTDILIEAACFDPVHIRRTSRKLGIPSEASQRFEKGLDPAGCDQAARRAAQLLVNYCGGTAAKGAVDVCAAQFGEKQILLRQERVNGLLGVNYTMEQINEVMAALSFGVAEISADTALITVPSYRRDITLEVDLIEEVARLMGFDQIPVTIPMNQTQGYRTRDQKLLLRMKELCAEHGLFETVNYSFISPKEAERLRVAADDPLRGGLTISNPLNEDQSVMRQSLLPGLLHTAARNYSRRNLDLRFFEIGNIFKPRFAATNILEEEHTPCLEQPQELPMLGIVVSGASAAGWLDKPQVYDFFYLKGIVESIFDALGISGISFRRITPAYLHPGRAAAILLQGETIGMMGEVHPLVTNTYELENRVIYADLLLEPLFAAAETLPQQHELPRYPAVNRDIALIGDAQVDAAAIEAVIREAGGEYLQNAELFDLYAGDPIPQGKRSLAYALTFVNQQRTLTDKEVDQAFAEIVKNLDRQLGLKLR
ncbi:MAG: phenylalanine--tRNA ligase subunit beta, partial [Clostridiales bacterium]